MIRFLLAALIALTPIAAYAQALPAPSYRKVTITGPGSTGDLSSMSVVPANSNAPQTLSDLMAGRMLTIGNDLTANGDAGISSMIPFGNTAAKHYQFSRRTSTQNSLLGTTAIIRNTPGGQPFGPAGADYALMLSATKDGWSTATGAAAKDGELDSLYGLARQGKKGDVAVLLLDVAKRRDNLITLAADENGGLLGYEIGATLVNASGQVYHEVHSYAPFLESPGGISGGRGFGFLTTAFKGTLFAAYGATVQPGGAGFQRFGFLDTTGAADGSGIIYEVDASGQVASGLPSMRANAGFRAADNAYSVRDETGAVIFAVGRTNKVSTAVGGLQIGSATTTVFRNASSGTATIPAIGLANTAYLTTIGLTGARPGDMVSAEIISADDGLAGFRVSAVVAANDNVKVRVQNLTGAAYAGGAAVAFTVKAERFQ